MIDFLNKGRKTYAEKTWEVAQSYFFPQDNAPAYKLLVAMQTVCDLSFELLEYPSYSPDLTPSDYHLFQQLKQNLNGRKFSSNEEVIEAVGGLVCRARNCLEALQVRCNKCIQLRGEYLNNKIL